MILVDTSIWVAVLRRRDPIDIDTLVDFGDVATCPPIIQEVRRPLGRRDRALGSRLPHRGVRAPT